MPEAIRSQAKSPVSASRLGRRSTPRRRARRRRRGSGAVTTAEQPSVVLPHAGLEGLAGKQHAREARAVGRRRGERRRRGSGRRAPCSRCRRCTARAGSAWESLPPRRIRDRSAAGCGRRTAGTAAPAAAASGCDSSASGARSGGSRRRSTGRARRRNRPRRGRRSTASGSTAGRRRASVTVVSDQITAALPLSQISVNRVTARPVPDGGIGPGHGDGLAGVQHLATARCRCRGTSPSAARSCGSVCATLPNVGSTCGVSSVR